MTPGNLPGVKHGILTPRFFSKIIKIFATSCQILRLRCTKFDFGPGSAPDPTGRAYNAHPDPLAGFKGASSKCGREVKIFSNFLEYGPHDFDPQSKK